MQKILPYPTTCTKSSFYSSVMLVRILISKYLARQFSRLCIGISIAIMRTNYTLSDSSVDCAGELGNANVGNRLFTEVRCTFLDQVNKQAWTT